MMTTLLAGYGLLAALVALTSAIIALHTRTRAAKTVAACAFLQSICIMLGFALAETPLYEWLWEALK